MRSSEQPDLVSPLVVAAHDAGSANQILGWLGGRQGLELRLCLAGPAERLWTAAFGRPEIVPVPLAMRGAGMLISGTSYDSELEHEARREAKRCGVLSIGVIDHWVNYPRRFVRHGVQVLPDEMWVCDEDADAIARATFPGVTVRIQPSRYLAGLVTEVRRAERDVGRHDSNRVLYALEPIRHFAGAKGEPGEFLALDFFFGSVGRLGLDATANFRLRPHPSDAAGKYDEWLNRNARWNVQLDPSSDLAGSIAWADTVVGCETYAMVIGLAAGRRVISSVPPGFPDCRLPMKTIIRLRDLPPLQLTPANP